MANATDTYLTGSEIDIINRLRVGTTIRWVLGLTKTAAGTAVPVFNMRFGAGATVTDTVRCSVTGSAQTAASDMGRFEVIGVVRATGASCVVQSHWALYHSGTTAGLVNVAQGLQKQALSTGFDATVASTKAGLSVNPGTAGVWTFQVISVNFENHA